MLSDEQLAILSGALVPLFQYLEQEVIRDIARRIKKTTSYTRTAENMAVDMMALGFSPDKIRQEALKKLNANKEYKEQVEKNTIEYKKSIAQKIADIVKAAQQAGDTIIGNAGKMAWIDDMSVWESNGQKLTNDSFLPQLVRAFQRQNKDQILNLTRTAGFKDREQFVPLQRAFTHELNKATIKICSGTFSQNQVVADTIQDLAQSGLRSVDYSTGRTMQLDTAVRLAVRTGCHQIAGEISKENILDTGVNMVYVGTHWGARNTGTGVANHAEWQGKVYYFGEKPSDAVLKAEAERIGQSEILDLWEATGYSLDGSKQSDPLGLYGYNCRHRHYAWFEGISQKAVEAPEPPPKEIDGKMYDYYAMTQKLREKERNIRGLYREREAKFALGQDTSVIDAKINNKTKDYYDFCDKAGVPRNTTKLRYYGSSSDLTKTKAWKDAQKEVKRVEAGYNNENKVFEIDQKAIDSVKLKPIEGLSAEKMENLTDMHKKILEVSMNENNSKEVAVLLDSSQSIIGDFVKGEADNVDLNISGRTKAEYAIHNHPNKGSFSNRDILWMVENNVKYFSIVKNDGSVEMLVKGEAYNKRQTIVEYNRLIKKYKKDIDDNVQKGYSKVVSELLKKPKTGLIYMG